MTKKATQRLDAGLKAKVALEALQNEAITEYPCTRTRFIRHSPRCWRFDLTGIPRSAANSVSRPEPYRPPDDIATKAAGIWPQVIHNNARGGKLLSSFVATTAGLTEPGRPAPGAPEGLPSRRLMRLTHCVAHA